MYTVYSKANCVQCTQAVFLLKNNGAEHEVKKLDEDYVRADLDKLIADSGNPPPRSFPVVFKDGVFVGSLPEVKALAAKGEF